VRAREPRDAFGRDSSHVRRTLENKAFAARPRDEKSFARALSCDMLRAESHGGGAFFPPQFFSRGVE
jgi:hypothetical protein